MRLTPFIRAETVRLATFLLYLAVFAFSLLVLADIFLLATPVSHAAPVPKTPTHVTAKVCGECHQDAAAAWRKSHHAWALKTANPQSVLGDFDGKDFHHGSSVMRFFMRDGKYFVETDDVDGKRTEHEIKYTVGVAPLQQYLIELKGGRLQALDVAWDTTNKNWFHIFPEQQEEPGDGLHWSGPYKNWNSRCAECHQTNFVKDYSPRKKTYRSTWSDHNVACEACHGLGAAHVGWARDPNSFDRTNWQGVNDKGLTHSFSPDDAQKETQLCARCHSRRLAFGAKSPPPSAKFGDHYQLALLRHGLYHADGQINEEVYVYGSYLQSKMYQRGVRCTNCHDAHSGELRADGNAVCTQCHSPSGNEDFPTLTKKNYDDSAHHHHKSGSEGAHCVSCHMPEKTYMQVDPRRDHSFRVPRPDLTGKIGAPNACTQCHSDKTAKWADEAIRKWFPNGRSGAPHFGEALHAGRKGLTERSADELIKLAADKSQPGIVRATALDVLRQSPSRKILQRVLPLLQDDDNLVRAAAVRLFETVPLELKENFLAPMLKDPVRAVRIEAGRQFAGQRVRRLSKADQLYARRAIDDYQQSIVANADFPETQMQIAGLAMTLKKFSLAERALRNALEMDPQLADAWISLARIQLALGKPQLARVTLEKAKEKLPGNGVIYGQLGAIFSELRQPRDAIAALKKSIKISGNSPELLELLALNLFADNKLDAARFYARTLASQYPGYQPNPLVRQMMRGEMGR